MAIAVCRQSIPKIKKDQHIYQPRNQLVLDFLDFRVGVLVSASASPVFRLLDLLFFSRFLLLTFLLLFFSWPQHPPNPCPSFRTSWHSWRLQFAKCKAVHHVHLLRYSPSLSFHCTGRWTPGQFWAQGVHVHVLKYTEDIYKICIYIDRCKAVYIADWRTSVLNPFEYIQVKVMGHYIGGLRPTRKRSLCSWLQWHFSQTSCAVSWCQLTCLVWNGWLTNGKGVKLSPPLIRKILQPLQRPSLHCRHRTGSRVSAAHPPACRFDLSAWGLRS